MNLFGLASLTAEFVPGGGIYPSTRFDGIRLLKYHQGFGLFIIICEVAFVVATIYFTVRAIKEIKKEKKEWFKEYWNYGELSIIGVSYAAIVMYIYRYVKTLEILDIFDKTMGNGYISMDFVAYLDEMFGYMISFVCFVSTLKLIKLLRFNRRMGMLSATISRCWDELSGFLIAFIITFIAFVQMFYILLYKNMVDFHNFISAVESSFSMMLGKFSFYEMQLTSMFAAAMFFVFAIMTSLILINLLLSIILRAFEQVKHDILSQPSDYQMVEFIKERFLAFLGASRSSRNVVTPLIEVPKKDENETKVNEFPEKVDKMLSYINNIYFDGALEINNKEAMKKMYLETQQNSQGATTPNIRRRTPKPK